MKKYIGIVIIIVMIFAFTAIVFAEQTEDVHGTIFDIAKYDLTQTPVVTYGSVIVDARNKDELLSYTSTMKTEISQMLGNLSIKEVNGTITFSRGITKSEFEEFVDVYDIDPECIYVRYLHADGTQGTAYSEFTGALDTIDSLIKDVAEVDPQAEVVGIISAEVNIKLDADKYNRMLKDNKMFCLDLASEIVAESQPGINMIQPANNLFWYMEDYGIIDYE